MFFRYVSVFFAFGLILGSHSIWSSEPWQDLSQEKVKEILNFSAVAFDRYRKPENFKALQEETGGQWTCIKEFSGTTGYYIPCTLGFMAHRKPLLASSPAEIMIAFRGIEMNRYELPDLLQIHGSFLKDIFDTWRRNSSNASDLLNIKGTIPSASLSFLSSVKKDLVEKLDESLEELHDARDLRITLTGATFGGTLATLAAPLIQKHLQEKGKNNVSIRTMTFGAANFGDAAFKKEYDKSFPLLDVKIPDPALSGVSNISSSLTKTQSLGTTITLKSIASAASASSMLGTYWSNFKLYFCPQPFERLVFNQPTFRLDVVCVEDFCTKDAEIYDALKKMEKS